MTIRMLLVVCLLGGMLASLLPAQDAAPLPFSFITVDGRVWSPRTRSGIQRLSFDADFRLHQLSNGLEAGDPLAIETLLAYPTMTVQPDARGRSFFSLPLVRMLLRVSLAQGCLEPRGRGYAFELSQGNRQCVQAILDLEEVSIGIDVNPGEVLGSYLDLTVILRELEIVLTPRDGHGRWRMGSRADFFNPGYPFPVAGFGNIPGSGPSGTRSVVGDDGGMAPFGATAFEGRAGDDPGPCRPVAVRVEGQGFWKRQCKGPHPSRTDLSEAIPVVSRTETFHEVEDVAGICAALSPSPRSGKCEQAEGQFMALLLNLATGRLAVCNCVSDPDVGDTTVASLVALLDGVLADPNRTREECTRAKDIADRANRGETLVSCVDMD